MLTSSFTIDSFIQSYLDCALWSSTDNADESGGEPLDANYSSTDIAPATLAQAQEDCTAFLDQDDLADAWETYLAEFGSEQAGHDFWLSRNGHGSGFFDRVSQTSCEAYEREQAKAIVSRDFSARESLIKTCGCLYHSCQRLQAAARVWGSVDLYIGDDGQIHA